MAAVRAVLKIIAIACWTLLLLPAQIAGLTVYRPLATRIPLLYHRGICSLLGLEVEIWGQQARQTPILYVANHSSWIDITVLAKLIPGSFIAKHEVAGWPFFGLLAKLQRSIFIERLPRHAASHRDEISARLEDGDSLILFPEGTSGDGNHVLPFKSALFAVAQRPIDDRALVVQPVTVAYTRLDFMPLGRHLRPYFTWYGNMPLGAHLWRVLGLGPSTVTVIFHEPVTFNAFASRKALAEHCRGVVAEGLSWALARRPPPALGADLRECAERGAGAAQMAPNRQHP